MIIVIIIFIMIIVIMLIIVIMMMTGYNRPTRLHILTGRCQLLPLAINSQTAHGDHHDHDHDDGDHDHNAGGNHDHDDGDHNADILFAACLVIFQ